MRSSKLTPLLIIEMFSCLMKTKIKNVYFKFRHCSTGSVSKQTSLNFSKCFKNVVLPKKRLIEIIRKLLLLGHKEVYLSQCYPQQEL